jgi:3-oxoacyl-[acyl-carrier-protein] synthase II
MAGPRRVVVSGIGAVSSVGIGVDDYWRGLARGDSGVVPMPELAALGVGVEVGAPVRDFEPRDFVDPDVLDGCGRTSQLGIAAAGLALEDAGYADASSLAAVGLRIFLGTTMGEANVQEEMVSRLHADGPKGLRPEDVLRVADSMVGLNVCRALGVDVPSLVFPTACAAGNYAIGYGYDLVRCGRAEVVLAGGCDAFSKIAFMGFGRMLALAPDVCRPFDRDRRGIVVGEGAGIVLLEERQRALERGAPIYAEMLGYGLSADAHHMTIPHVDGVEAVMRAALTDAEIDADAVGLVCAHGTGTRINDKTEYRALERVFGGKAQRVPVMAPKSMLGHTMGAASALEAIACILALYHGVLPPTINFVTPDEECPVDCVPNQARQTTARVALNNAFAFGGNNAATVFARPDL